MAAVGGKGAVVRVQVACGTRLPARHVRVRGRCYAQEKARGVVRALPGMRVSVQVAQATRQ